MSEHAAWTQDPHTFRLELGDRVVLALANENAGTPAHRLATLTQRAGHSLRERREVARLARSLAAAIRCCDAEAVDHLQRALCARTPRLRA